MDNVVGDSQGALQSILLDFPKELVTQYKVYYLEVY